MQKWLYLIRFHIMNLHRNPKLATSRAQISEQVCIYIYTHVQATVGFMEEDTAGQHWPLSLGRILIAQRSTEAC